MDFNRSHFDWQNYEDAPNAIWAIALQQLPDADIQLCAERILKHRLSPAQLLECRAKLSQKSSLLSTDYKNLRDTVAFALDLVVREFAIPGVLRKFPEANLPGFPRHRFQHLFEDL